MITYPQLMHQALLALANDQLDDALRAAFKARDIALYKMMQPIGSYYVKQPHIICETVYMLRRLNKHMEIVQ